MGPASMSPGSPWGQTITTGRPSSTTRPPAPRCGPARRSRTAPAASSANDWIALYKVGDPNTAYMTNLSRFTGGATSGTFTFTTPAIAGQYEFRYLLNNGFTDVARSAAITVTGGTTPYTLT